MGKKKQRRRYNKIKSFTPAKSFNPAMLTSIVVNDGLADIQHNTNPYGVARRLLEIVLSYCEMSAYDEVKLGKVPSKLCSCRNGLKLAARYGHMDLINYFVGKGANNWEDGLIEASRGGHLDLIKYFRSKITYLHPYWIVDVAAEAGHLDIVEYVISNKMGDWNHALHGFAIRGDKKLIDYCIEKGANDWRQGLTGAVKGGHRSLMDWFIEKGADTKLSCLREAAEYGHMDLVVYYLTSDMSHRVYWGIDSAIEGGHLDIFIHMVHADHEDVFRGDLHARKLDWCYLEDAAEHDKLNIIEYCISQGEDNWHYGVRGAAKGGHFHLIEYFIEKGFPREEVATEVDYNHHDICDYYMN